MSRKNHLSETLISYTYWVTVLLFTSLDHENQGVAFCWLGNTKHIQFIGIISFGFILNWGFSNPLTSCLPFLLDSSEEQSWYQKTGHLVEKCVGLPKAPFHDILGWNAYSSAMASAHVPWILESHQTLLSQICAAFNAFPAFSTYCENLKQSMKWITHEMTSSRYWNWSIHTQC